MTATDFEDRGESAGDGALATAMNWAGALLSVLLIAGLAAWGWQLWVRDVTGVPVIRALAGPMRVLPDDPGGLANGNRGLTVNRLAEERAGAAPEREAVLVSEPAALDERQDLAMGALPGAASDAEGATVVVSETPRFGPEASGAVQEASPRSATDLAVREALAGFVTAPSVPAAGATGAARSPAMVRPPPRRPEGGLHASSENAAGPGVPEVPSSAVAPGTRLVQFGAYEDADAARDGWRSIAARFGAYMVGKRRVVQEVTSGDRTFYRLRATGFVDLADARRFCSVLRSDGADCVPVVQR